VVSVAISEGGPFYVLRRRHAGQALEFVGKITGAVEATVKCHFGDGVVSGAEKKLGVINSHLFDICQRGGSVIFFELASEIYLAHVQTVGKSADIERLCEAFVNVILDVPHPLRYKLGRLVEEVKQQIKKGHTLVILAAVCCVTIANLHEKVFCLCIVSLKKAGTQRGIIF